MFFFNFFIKRNDIRKNWIFLVFSTSPKSNGTLSPLSRSEEPQIIIKKHQLSSWTNDNEFPKQTELKRDLSFQKTSSDPLTSTTITVPQPQIIWENQLLSKPQSNKKDKKEEKQQNYDISQNDPSSPKS